MFILFSENRQLIGDLNGIDNLLQCLSVRDHRLCFPPAEDVCVYNQFLTLSFRCIRSMTRPHLMK